MLREAQQRGIRDAHTTFRIKEAGGVPAPIRSALSFGRSMAIGELPTVARQAYRGGLKEVFAKPIPHADPAKAVAGGILHPLNVLWPTIPGSRAKTWLYRGMGALPMIGAVQAARGKAGDPSESRLSNTLGAVGSGVGLMYGGMAGGMLGAPLLGSAGHHLGKGLGRMFSRRPSPAPPPPAPPVRQGMGPGPDEPPLMNPYARGM